MALIRRDWIKGRSLSLEKCLYLINEFLASDERDYIYAILALVSDAGSLVPYPDYTMAIHNVYRNVMISYIKRQQGLDLMYSRTRSNTESPLPSWVLDWKTGGVCLTKNSLFVLDAEEKGSNNVLPDGQYLSCTSRLTLKFSLVEECALTPWMAIHFLQEKSITTLVAYPSRFISVVHM